MPVGKRATNAVDRELRAILGEKRVKGCADMWLKYLANQ